MNLLPGEEAVVVVVVVLQFLITSLISMIIFLFVMYSRGETVQLPI